MTEHEPAKPPPEPGAAEQQPAPPPRRRAARATSAAAQLSSLFRVSSQLVAEREPQRLFASVVARVIEALPTVQAGVVWIDERVSGRLRVAAQEGLPLDVGTRQALAGASLRYGEGLVGAAFQRDQTQIAESRLGYRDAVGPVSHATMALFHQIGEQLPRRVTVLAAPLRVGSEQIGVLELISFDPGRAGWRPIQRDDMAVLQTFAELVASAIKNARLYDAAQRSERRLKAFDAVVTAISTAADLPDLVRSVLDVVVALVPRSCGALLLYDPAHERLELAAQQGLSQSGVAALRQMDVADSPCAEVVHYGQPMLRPLLEERGEAVFLADGLLTAAYYPLLAGGSVAGVLTLFGDIGLAERADKETLMPICNQVGFAIANVRLYADSTSERRKLNTVVTSIAEGVLLCDARGRLTLANEAALSLLRLDGLPFEQPLTEMSDFYRMRDLEGRPLSLDQLPFARALAGEVFQDYRLILAGASGDETVMSFSGAPARADDGTIEGAVVVFRDVTASQKLEQAKDEFLAVAAHELRSPLAAVRSYADLLLRREQQRGGEADPRDIHGLTILTQQVSHMLRMVDNLLDVSRIDAGQLDLMLQQVNLVALTRQVLDQQRPAAGTRELVLETDQDEVMVACDSLRIRQVLTNLIGNAIKYSPPESTVTVWLRRICPENGAVGLLPDGVTLPAALVRVSDTGSGMTRDQQGRLFERYYRARSHRAEGLGLGLYLSRQFVRMHGGSIWVESGEGTGSTFSFTLPMKEAE